MPVDGRAKAPDRDPRAERTATRRHAALAAVDSPGPARTPAGREHPPKAARSHAGGAGEHAIVPVGALSLGDSPRLRGENAEHTRLLAQSDTEMPPILVHRASMRVIDGAHRLRAAILRGDRQIRVRFFDGECDEAFVLAVETNMAHGLPLSLADREAAAARIVVSHPQWSDRAIASVTGLSAKTVNTIRRETDTGLPELRSRVGRDGRVRPLTSADGRLRACELFTRSPDASLRKVAEQAGISLGTARDVRRRMERGDDPIPPQQRARGERREPPTVERQLRRAAVAGRVNPCRDPETILHQLQRDPSVRFTDSGRHLLRWLNDHMSGVRGWESLGDTMPTHCAYMIADLACAVAEEWLEFAEHLRRRAESTA
ncbi:ParB/RepB/Spo0J family partition protein [Sphaerisporangium sp. TRM90804]|uniref:ParB/RepB/Spo0J family partition protein n=1 Tax=Sphaerisporangium sp. TRM90804 TaxID=3031113 RepID=UPI00244BCFBC|nr:ParB/RepB/Spo0J family partition protein [Sphaerisporangium sp. TRM90804]MDH2428022.1 ParB/RepB/Spo0J family partition protein [Sphaerisporangium sp. TRM90804]